MIIYGFLGTLWVLINMPPRRIVDYIPRPWGYASDFCTFFCSKSVFSTVVRSLGILLVRIVVKRRVSHLVVAYQVEIFSCRWVRGADNAQREIRIVGESRDLSTITNPFFLGLRFDVFFFFPLT